MIIQVQEYQLNRKELKRTEKKMGVENGQENIIIIIFAKNAITKIGIIPESNLIDCISISQRKWKEKKTTNKQIIYLLDRIFIRFFSSNI